MKILYFAGGPQSGVVPSLSQELRKRGHEVVIGDVCGSNMALPHVNSFTLYLAGAAVLRYRRKWRQGYYHTKASFDVFRKQAERLLVNVQPDMVLQSGCLYGLSAPAVPYVLYLDHTHAISQAYPAWPGLPANPRTSSVWLALERATYHRAHRILVTHEFVRASLISDYDVSDSKIQVVHEGPVLSVIPDVTRQQDDGRTVLFAGRPLRNKGGLVLLRAMSRVRQQIPDAHLLVVGVNGPSDNNVTYVDWVPSAEIATYYKRATVFTLPSLRAGGLVLLEAMAHGLPCIGTKVEALPEIIADGETGFIIPPGDDEALAERLVQLLKDPELRQRMGNAGQVRQARQFTWQKVADAVEASLS